MSVNLQTILDQSYIDPNGRSKQLGDYHYDHELSNDENAIYYNSKDNRLLVGMRGSANADDALTDVSLGAGQLRNTNRYKRSADKHRQAKNKYKGAKTVVVGHSLGGSLASAIGDDDDDIITFNKGNTLLSNTTTTKKNEKSYRVKGDVVSLIPDKNTKTIKSKKGIGYYFKPWWMNVASDHSTGHLQNQHIYV